MLKLPQQILVMLLIVHQLVWELEELVMVVMV